MHLDALHSDFSKRFDDILKMNIPDWTLDPFLSANTEDSSKLQEALMKVTTNDKFKLKKWLPTILATNRDPYGLSTNLDCHSKIVDCISVIILGTWNMWNVRHHSGTWIQRGNQFVNKNKGLQIFDRDYC